MFITKILVANKGLGWDSLYLKKCFIILLVTGILREDIGRLPFSPIIMVNKVLFIKSI